MLSVLKFQLGVNKLLYQEQLLYSELIYFSQQLAPITILKKNYHDYNNIITVSNLSHIFDYCTALVSMHTLSCSKSLYQK